MKKLLLSAIIVLSSAFSVAATDMYVKTDSDIFRVPVSEVDSVVHAKYDTLFNFLETVHEPSLGACPAVYLYHGGTPFFACDQSLMKSLFYSKDSIKGIVADFSSCKSEDDGYHHFRSDTTLTYHYDASTKILTIKTIDEVLNCCAELIGSTFNLYGDTLVFDTHSYENFDGRELFYTKIGTDICKCICFFDVTYEVPGIEAKSYYIEKNGFRGDIDLSQYKDGVVIEPKISGYNVGVSRCKNDNAFSDAIPETADMNDVSIDSDTLVSYAYNPLEGTVTFISYNRMFNCCSPSIGSQMIINNDTVVINSYELPDSVMCDCICPYDVTTSLNEVKPQLYHFIVDGTEFDVDFSQNPSGFVKKDPIPVGRFFAKSECQKEFEEKTELRNVMRGEFSDTLASYTYDPATNELYVVSYNQELNCCSEVNTETTFSDGSFTIKTTEENANCRCYCFFNVTTKITDVKEQKYHIDVDDVWFDVDLSQQTSGVIFRNSSPNGVFDGSSSCKSALDDVDKAGIALADTLVTYKYDRKNGVLHVVSCNRYLNCCSDKGTMTKIKDDEVFVSTVETTPICKCMCSYDLYTKIAGLDEKLYHFRVDGDSFDVDLSKVTEGFVLRDTVSKGFFVTASACKSEHDEKIEVESASTRGVSDTLVYYNYDPSKMELYVISYNQQLHCCADINSVTSIQDANVKIKSTEGGELCRCYCFYDVYTKLTNIKKQKFHLDVDGVQFDIDLNESMSDYILR